MYHIIQLHHHFNTFYNRNIGIDLIYDSDHNELYFETYRGDIQSTIYYIARNDTKVIINVIKNLLKIYNNRSNNKISLDSFSGEGCITFDFREDKVYISRYSSNNGDVYNGPHLIKNENRIIGDLNELLKEVEHTNKNNEDVSDGSIISKKFSIKEKKI